MINDRFKRRRLLRKARYLDTVGGADDEKSN